MMNQTSPADKSSTRHGTRMVRVRVRGNMGPSAARALPGFSVTHEEQLTVVQGRLRSGRSLADLLAELQAFGLEIVDVRSSGP